MKLMLIDQSNQGILYVGDNWSIANQLKSGLVDTTIRVFFPKNPNYDKVQRQAVLGGQQICLRRNGGVEPLSANEINSVFLERQRLVGLRYPLTEMLVGLCITATPTCRPSPWDGIENNIQKALDACSPVDGTFSDAVLEYAQINHLAPAHAYRELALHADNISRIKIRVYGLMKYFVDKINTVSCENDRVCVESEMMDRFVKDISI